jgi:hypothetical protein
VIDSDEDGQDGEYRDGEESVEHSESDAAAQLTPEEELGTFGFSSLIQPFNNILLSEMLKKNWHSPIYSFFKSDVNIKYLDGRPCQFFTCAVRKCKTPLGGVRRFQDSKDCSSTANLKHHAKKCFGNEAVKNAEGWDGGQSGSIFAAFANQARLPKRPSCRAHTNQEVRYVLSHPSHILLFNSYIAI